MPHNFFILRLTQSLLLLRVGDLRFTQFLLLADPGDLNSLYYS